MALAKSAHQGGTQKVAGGLAGHQADAAKTARGRRHGPQRMMPRWLPATKAATAATSG